MDAKDSLVLLDEAAAQIFTNIKWNYYYVMRPDLLGGFDARSDSSASDKKGVNTCYVQCIQVSVV